MNPLEERRLGSKAASTEREKVALRRIRPERELAQPQLYGTSYLLEKNTLIGQWRRRDERSQGAASFSVPYVLLSQMNGYSPISTWRVRLVPAMQQGGSAPPKEGFYPST